ncbi:MAG TPA: alpha/beta hydrolase, partial [Bryobacteraceae bacterium]|nr:alpha/beta hydrolase [Bryobacteraceae bacterium]
IDQGPDGIPISSLTLRDSNLKFAVDAVRGAYEGNIGTDGASIAGTWTQGKPLPLEFQRATQQTAWSHDASRHAVQFVTVDKDVKLEVLDWGGSGRPVVLLAGLGNTAHIFDKFATKLTSTYHVYGVTRRGFGVSSAPAPDSANYTADRLGDDVLAVCDSLKLNKPVVIGHSIAGEELSSIGSRHPEKIAALIYLDAGYAYAYNGRSRGDLSMGRPTQSRTPQIPAISQAILAGEKKYTAIHGPILAIYALPHDLAQVSPNDPAGRAAAEARDAALAEEAKAFETGVPSARIVRIPHANHFVFISNEADVLREVNAFLRGLP